MSKYNTTVVERRNNIIAPDIWYKGESLPLAGNSLFSKLNVDILQVSVVEIMAPLKTGHKCQPDTPSDKSTHRDMPVSFTEPGTWNMLLYIWFEVIHIFI